MDVTHSPLAMASSLRGGSKGQQGGVRDGKGPGVSHTVALTSPGHTFVGTGYGLNDKPGLLWLIARV